MVKISIVVMSHPKRSKEAFYLAGKLLLIPFHNVKIRLDSENNEWDNGYKCWQSVSNDSDWSVVIQDDAIISSNFYDNLEKAIDNIPQEGLLSLYLGEVRPYRYSVAKAFNYAIGSGASYLTSIGLYWGVCVLMPTSKIKDVLNASEALNRYLYDVRLGKAATSLKMPIYYTTQSLVDHDDELDSLIGHKAHEKRVAHKYQPSIINEWNSKVVKIL